MSTDDSDIPGGPGSRKGPGSREGPTEETLSSPEEVGSAMARASTGPPHQGGQTAYTLRQVSLLLDGISLMAATTNRESTAICSGALSAALRLVADAVDSPCGSR
jgi:hypothetical protein